MAPVENQRRRCGYPCGLSNIRYMGKYLKDISAK
jgi:hypothetical protein